ncbi:MAG: SHOCT domain-containing protein [Deltaproteobacteria bacterium]|nr:SHOCT domain-containing protein [Deltaproteobacteria bacterium]
MMGGGMGGWMILQMVLWLVVIVGFVALAVWVVLRFFPGGNGRNEQSALDILKKRYARGEITREEYEEKKREIS